MPVPVKKTIGKTATMGHAAGMASVSQVRVLKDTRERDSGSLTLSILSPYPPPPIFLRPILLPSSSPDRTIVPIELLDACDLSARP